MGRAIESLRKLLWAACFAFLFFSKTFAQSNVSLKYFGLTIHPFGDDMANIQPYKLDDEAYFVLNFGGIAEYEKFIWEDIVALTVSQGIFNDCSNGLSGISHIGLQVLLLEKNKHRLYVDGGPTFYVREDWNRFKDYEDLGNFERRKMYNRSWQYRLFLISGAFEYDYDISSNKTISVSIIPLPVVAFGFGFKYWFNKDFKRTDKLLMP